MNAPRINVTPLIDVLLVLLIIFMVVSPLKPSAFRARIPSEPINTGSIRNDDLSLVVTIAHDGTVKLNSELAGKIGDDVLVPLLKKVFAERAENGVASEHFPGATERTVFVKAPKSMDYGTVTRVVDEVNIAGAYPISLQIDGLD